VLCGIIKQVGEHLGEPGHVGIHVDGAGWNVDHEFVIFGTLLVSLTGVPEPSCHLEARSDGTAFILLFTGDFAIRPVQSAE
jgi:hypothetical protein